MPTDVPAAISFLIQTCPTFEWNNEDNVSSIQADVDFMFFRLLQIDSDNFGAFVASARHCVDLVQSMKKNLPPNVFYDLTSQIKSIIKTDIISMTAKSSEQGGQLLKDVLNDEVTENHFLIEKNSKNGDGLLEKVRNLQGPKQDNPQRQEIKQ